MASLCGFHTLSHAPWAKNYIQLYLCWGNLYSIHIHDITCHIIRQVEMESRITHMRETRWGWKNVLVLVENFSVKGGDRDWNVCELIFNFLNEQIQLILRTIEHYAESSQLKIELIRARFQNQFSISISIIFFLSFVSFPKLSI